MEVREEREREERAKEAKRKKKRRRALSISPNLSGLLSAVLGCAIRLDSPPGRKNRQETRSWWKGGLGLSGKGAAFALSKEGRCRRRLSRLARDRRRTTTTLAIAASFVHKPSSFSPRALDFDTVRAIRSRAHRAEGGEGGHADFVQLWEEGRGVERKGRKEGERAAVR